MRFLLSAITLLALANTLNAKLMTASVGPISENPIPVWGNPSADTCHLVGSCDACQIVGNQYCYYKHSGDATCCVGLKPIGGDDHDHNNNNNNNNNNNHHRHHDDHHDDHDRHHDDDDDGDKDDDNDDKDDKDDDDAKDDDEDDDDENNLQDSGGLVASVGPITSNPIPSWGKPSSDSCSSVGSCDACEAQGAQYCYYKHNGDATCCQGDPLSSNTNTQSNTQDSASVQTTLPSWAQPSDTCTRRRSCDVCQGMQLGNVYCKYTDSGVPMCCSANPSTNNNDNTKNNEDDGQP